MFALATGELLRVVPDLSTASTIVTLQYHEHINGSGYPTGLQRDGIRYFSRITAVGDVYETLMANRVYRDAYRRMALSTPSGQWFVRWPLKQNPVGHCPSVTGCSRTSPVQVPWEIALSKELTIQIVGE